MKKLLLIVLCISISFIASNSFSESDEIYSAWVNMKYSSGNPPQKLTFHYDGTFASYILKDSNDSLKRGMYRITKKWRDPEGNIWYQIIMQDPRSEKRYKLARISDDGKQLEFISKTDKYPLKITFGDTDYCKYKRE